MRACEWWRRDEHVTQERVIVFGCEGSELIGILHDAAIERQSGYGVVVVVGGPQYRVGSHRQFVLLARDLARAGHVVLRFDYRGMGDSTGRSPGFENVGADLRAAVEALIRETPAVSRIAVYGLCDAASAAMIWGVTDTRIDRLIVVNPWVRTAAGEAGAFVRHYYGRRLLQASLWKKVLSGGFAFGPAIRDLLAKVVAARRAEAPRDGGRGETFQQKMLAGFSTFNGKILVVLSEDDLTAKEFEALSGSDPAWRRSMSRSTVRVCHIPESDHTFSTLSAKESLQRTVREWLEDGSSAPTAVGSTAPNGQEASR